MEQPDYYAVLGVLPTAPDAEITRAWRRLVLSSHPDKQHASSSLSPSPSPSPSPSGSAQTTGRPEADIRLINEARAVLSDPVRRAEFDSARLEPNGKGNFGPPPPSGPRIREYVSLEAFTPHPSEEDPQTFTLECRCGQEYVVTVDDLEAGVDVVGCPGCGEYVGVEYEVVEDE